MRRNESNAGSSVITDSDARFPRDADVEARRDAWQAHDRAVCCKLLITMPPVTIVAAFAYVVLDR